MGSAIKVSSTALFEPRGKSKGPVSPNSWTWLSRPPIEAAARRRDGIDNGTVLGIRQDDQCVGPGTQQEEAVPQRQRPARMCLRDEAGTCVHQHAGDDLC
jgi:hypothetical protein